MKSLWNDREAENFEGELGLRVYTSRLLGCDPSLVLHGGGNTSVKTRKKNIFGEEEEVLLVKGSGHNLATIDKTGFSPVRLEPLRKIVKLDTLSDFQLVNLFRSHLVDPTAPFPSVESLLHAILPGKFVDHTHADSVAAIANSENGQNRIRNLYGSMVVVIPYVMSGFLLARAVADQFPRNTNRETVGMIVMNHGIFSFGESARDSYERMITLVDMAERYLKENNAWELPPADEKPAKGSIKTGLARLRREISEAAGRPLILSARDSARGMSFARSDKVEQISQRGPATPDHVIYTKRIPMVGRDASAYRNSYRKYFETYGEKEGKDLRMLDPAPRVVLDPEFGLCTVGRSPKEAEIASDLYEHTMEIILRAEALGGYHTLSPREIFDVEYWEPEQAKLLQSENLPVFTGETALVTGAASGIGKACVESLLKRGAAVMGLDIDSSVETLYFRSDFVGIRCDITSEEEFGEALEKGVREFGGVDMLILNAGIFPASRDIADLSMAEWRRVMAVNTDANLSVLRECHPFLQSAPKGGRVVVIGSKNVPAPGKGAGAYSASKSALTQLARVAAMEWGGDGIRINIIHPNAVFDTGVWTEEVLASRARSYGISVEEYKKRNLLNVEVSSADVAEMAAEMCGPLFAKTTASQVPIDGGNDRVV